MTFFLIAAVPLFIPLCLALFFPERSPDRGIFIAYLKGLLWFLPFLLVFYLFKNSLSPDYTARGIYGYYLLHDYLFPVVMSLLGYLVLFRASSRLGAGPDPAGTTMFFCGYFTFFGILELILRFRWFDFQILFMRPVIFIILILYLSGMTYLAFSQEGWLRIFLLICAAAISVALATVPLLYRLSYKPISLAVCLVLFGGSFFFLKMITKGERYT